MSVDDLIEMLERMSEEDRKKIVVHERGLVTGFEVKEGEVVLTGELPF